MVAVVEDQSDTDLPELVQWVAGIAELRPALIVIELDRPAGWLPTVRSDPATRRIPVIAIAETKEVLHREQTEEAHA